jgi:hypothetical protein|tara:strand:+ start:120 stop:293 length:174 start_codon:yes stop_codon:yes gene_type:complete
MISRLNLNKNNIDNKMIILSLINVPMISPTGKRQNREKIILDTKVSLDNFSRKLSKY